MRLPRHTHAPKNGATHFSFSYLSPFLPVSEPTIFNLHAISAATTDLHFFALYYYRSLRPPLIYFTLLYFSFFCRRSSSDSIKLASMDPVYVYFYFSAFSLRNITQNYHIFPLRSTSKMDFSRQIDF